MTRPQPPIDVLYDGQCPVCQRTVRYFRRRDRHDRLNFIDITGDAFNADDYGLTQAAVMASVHAVSADGRAARGMDAMRIMMRAVGRGWLAAPTGWPILRPIFDWLYRSFARLRPRGDGCDDRCAPRR